MGRGHEWTCGRLPLSVALLEVGTVFSPILSCPIAAVVALHQENSADRTCFLLPLRCASCGPDHVSLLISFIERQRTQSWQTPPIDGASWYAPGLLLELHGIPPPPSSKTDRRVASWRFGSLALPHLLDHGRARAASIWRQSWG